MKCNGACQFNKELKRGTTVENKGKLILTKKRGFGGKKEKGEGETIDL